MAKSRYVSAVGINFALEGSLEAALDDAVYNGQIWGPKSKFQFGSRIGALPYSSPGMRWRKRNAQSYISYMKDAIDGPTITSWTTSRETMNGYYRSPPKRKQIPVVS